MPFYAGLGRRKSASSGNTGSIRRTLEDLPAAERHEWLGAQVRAAIAAVLGLEREQVGARQRLFDLGVDSLMALELRNRLQTIFDLRLSQTFVFDYPRMEAIVAFLSGELGLDDVPPEELESADSADSRVDGLGRISEDEAEELLLQELEKMSF